MYVFRNADEIKDTLEPAFCYWAARSRIYTGVGYKIPSIDSFHDEFTYEGGEGGEMVCAIVFIVTGIFPSICANY